MSSDLRRNSLVAELSVEDVQAHAMALGFDGAELEAYMVGYAQARKLAYRYRLALEWVRLYAGEDREALRKYVEEALGDA